MNLIESYLKHIQERVQSPNKLNAPCAAYELIYNKRCPHNRGMYTGPHESKIWNGIRLDGHLEDKWLNNLSNIKGIEIRSSCEGHNKDWVTFIVFRFLNKNKNRNNKLIKSKLESDKITKVSNDVGNMGFVRYVVAAKLWYGQPGWEKWWSTIAKRINGAIK